MSKSNQTDLDRLLAFLTISKIRKARDKSDATPDSYMHLTGGNFGVDGAYQIVNLQHGKGTDGLYTVFYFDRKGKFLHHGTWD